MRRILIVDPDSMTRSQIGLALRHWGYGVIEAHNGGDAFAKVNNELVDLILLSDALPDGSDFESFCYLRHATTPMIKLMTVTVLGNGGGGIRMGTEESLVKPVLLSELREMVEKSITTDQTTQLIGAIC